MNRHAVQTALRRVPVDRTASRCLASRTFSTTSSFQADEKSTSAPSTTGTSGPNSSRQRSAEAAAKLGALLRSRQTQQPAAAAPAAAPTPPVDARSLAAKPASSGSANGPKVINIRSLRSGGARGGLGGRGPVRFVGRGPSGGGGERGGDGKRPGGDLSARFGARFDGGAGGGAGGRPGGPRSLGRLRTGAGGPRTGAGARGGARGGAAHRRKDGDDKKKEKKTDKPVDREWTPGEMEVLDRLDLGEATPYTPQVALESLIGYGPAVATDNRLGKLESALRTMRVVGGGLPFDADPTATVDVKAFAQRYLHDKKPFFFNSKEEKKWLEQTNGIKVRGPAEPTKQALVEAVIMGKYEAPKFTEIKDVPGTIARYQSQEATYRASHCAEFTEKVLEILPKPKAGGKATRA